MVSEIQRTRQFDRPFTHALVEAKNGVVKRYSRKARIQRVDGMFTW